MNFLSQYTFLKLSLVGFVRGWIAEFWSSYYSRRCRSEWFDLEFAKIRFLKPVYWLCRNCLGETGACFRLVRWAQAFSSTRMEMPFAVIGLLFQGILEASEETKLHCKIIFWASLPNEDSRGKSGRQARPHNRHISAKLFPPNIILFYVSFTEVCILMNLFTYTQLCDTFSVWRTASQNLEESEFQRTDLLSPRSKIYGSCRLSTSRGPQVSTFLLPNTKCVFQEGYGRPDK